MSRSRASPRKFAEKIALLNKKEAEANAEFEKIIKEVEESTRTPQRPAIFYQDHNLPAPQQHQHQQNVQYASSGGSHEIPLQYQDQNNIHQYHTEVNQNWPQHPGEPHQQVLYESPNIIQGNSVSENSHHSGFAKSDRTQLQYQPVSQQIHHQQQQVQHNHSPRLDGVPNIKIYAIDDTNSTHHQQHVNSNSSINNSQCSSITNVGCPTLMSSARSLPDIANLHVSGAFAPVPIAASYSDQRIPTCGSNNNLLGVDSSSNPYCSNDFSQHNNQQTLSLHQHHNQPHTTSQHQQVLRRSNPPSTSPWQNNSKSNYDGLSNGNMVLAQHQQVVCQKSQQQGSIVRASSFSTVSNGFLDKDTLSTPDDCNNLSRSSDGYHSFLENYNPSTNTSYVPDSNVISTHAHNFDNRFIAKSNSHNNIDDISLQADITTQNELYPQQTSLGNPDQGQLYETEEPDLQLFE